MLILGTKYGVELVQQYSRYSMGVAVGRAFNQAEIESMLVESLKEWSEL